jgi:polysaccharide export outer membrane protein
MAAGTNADSMLLHEGDSLEVKFPSTPEMDCKPTVRSDGKITIPMAGEIKVSGMTPEAAKQAVLQAAGPMLKVKDATLTVQNAAFIVYVFGAVMRPGEIVSDRPLTPFEAVIKAGIDNEKSNLSRVKVIRIDEQGQAKQKVLNLKQIITQGKTVGFALKPNDKIYVPQKFSVY